MAVHEWLHLQKPTSTTAERLNLHQDGTNSSVCLGIMLKNKRATSDSTMAFPLFSMAQGNLLDEYSLFMFQYKRQQHTLLHILVYCQRSCISLSQQYQISTYNTDQITQQSSCLVLCIAPIGMVWSPLGSPRNGQAMLHPFQKHLINAKG